MRYKFTFTLVLAFFIVFTVKAQLVNNGATIIVKNGATLHVDSDVTNTTGTIQLESNATLEVSGDFKSEVAASFDAHANSTVKFFGANTKEITSGGDDFGIVLMNKDDGINMNLLDDMTIINNLDFTPANGNKLNLGNLNLILGDTATITNFGTDRYIQADGTGFVKKNYPTNSSFEFPIGDVDEYSPITTNLTGATFNASPEIAVRVIDAVHPNKYADAESHITRYWEITDNDLTGHTIGLTGTYTDADIEGTEASIKGASYIADWSFANSGANNANNTVSGDITTDADFSGMNHYGKLNLTLLLQGPYNSGTSEMKTLLNSKNLIPVSSPYDATSVGAIPNADIVDWIKIEYTDVNSVVQAYSVFLDKTGTVLDIDGSSGKNLKDVNNMSDIIVIHRNHLGIKTTSPLDFNSGTATYDFTTSAAQTVGGKQADLTGGKFGMYAGNANGDSASAGAYKFIRMTGPASINDYSELLSRLGGTYTNIITNIYDYEDLNMDGNIRMTGPATINDYSLLLSVLGGTYTNIISRPF